MAWTDKMVEDLRIMWKQGLTTGEIGKRLGVSKNSIVGKVHRLQLDARPSPIKKKDEIDNTPASKPSEKTSPCRSKNNSAKKVENNHTPKVDTPKVEPEAVPERIFIPKPAVPTKTFNGNAKLTDLDNHTCRWPLGDPKDENFHFCGRKVRTGQTYCDEHAALAYVKPNAKK